MSYQCLGGDNYRVKLVLYRDCFAGGAAFDSADSSLFVGTVTLYEGDSTTPLLVNGSDQINLDPPEVSPITQVNSGNFCQSPNGNLCLEQGVYLFDVTLPVTNEPIHVVYQRCCRAWASTNIVDPGITGMTFAITITPAARNVCNDSPDFDKNPMVCAFLPNSSFHYDHSAVDLEGDSLVYSFCTPFTGGGPNTANATGPGGVAPNPDMPPPFEPIVFDTLYSAFVPIPGNPPYGIDPSTGEVTGSPNIPGAFVYGICVDEYRNGQLLSTVRLESIHYIIGDPVPTKELYKEQETFQVVPNPVRGIAFFELPESSNVYTIELFDLNGKIWKTQSNVASGRQQLSTDGLTAGVYYLRVFTDDRFLFSRLVVL